MKIDIIRAWKDGSYRASLSDEELALLPKNPVGQFDLTDEELKAVCGSQAQTGGGIGSSIGIGGCANTSQQGICQSVGGGSQCASQQGNCQSTQGRCNSQGNCQRTLAGVGVC